MTHSRAREENSGTEYKIELSDPTGIYDSPDERDAKIVELIKEHVDTSNESLKDLIVSHARLALLKMSDWQRERDLEEVTHLIESYFKGLVAIPDPQATKESLKTYIFEGMRGKELTSSNYK